MHDDETVISVSKRIYSEDQDRLPEPSATDAEWQWLDSSSQGRRPLTGLLSQTIHEEDDDSE